MKRIFVLCVILASLGSLWGADRHGAIKLLDGYAIEDVNAPGLTVDTENWSIKKANGDFRIYFEAGHSEGQAADPKDKSHFKWYREQEINGYKVHIALAKAGARTAFKKTRKGADVLIVTFLLDKSGNWDYDANFTAQIKNEQELADALLMILTFDPSKCSC